MPGCDEVTQIDINVPVCTVRSGGMQTMDILVWDAVQKLLFCAKGQIITKSGPFNQEPSHRIAFSVEQVFFVVVVVVVVLQKGSS